MECRWVARLVEPLPAIFYLLCVFLAGGELLLEAGSLLMRSELLLLTALLIVAGLVVGMEAMR